MLRASEGEVAGGGTPSSKQYLLENFSSLKHDISQLRDPESELEEYIQKPTTWTLYRVAISRVLWKEWESMCIPESSRESQFFPGTPQYFGHTRTDVLWSCRKHLLVLWGKEACICELGRSTIFFLVRAIRFLGFHILEQKNMSCWDSRCFVIPSPAHFFFFF